MSTKEALLALCKEHEAGELDETVYTECANFLFLTSWFEEWLFNEKKRQNPANTKILCSELQPKLKMQKFSCFGEYFAKRYLEDGKIVEQRLEGLRFQKDKDKEDVRQVLLDISETKPDNANTLFAYIMITYRFRNNMFHGNKGMIRLHDYTDQFEIINYFLIDLLKEIFRINYKGFNGGELLNGKAHL